MSKNLSLKKIYIYYLLYFLIIPLGFSIRIIYTHSLSLKELGIIYSLYSFFGFFSIFTNMGFSASLKYFIPKYEIKNEYKKISNIFYYSLIIQQIILWFLVIIIFFLSNWISINYFHDEGILIYFRLFILYFIFSNLFAFFSDLFVAYKLNIIYQSIYLFNLLFIAFFSFFYSFDDTIDKLYYYELFIILAYFFTFIIYFYFTCKNYPYLLKGFTFEKKLFLKFFYYSISVFGSSLGLVFLFQTDIVVITYFLPIENVGYYSNSLILINMLINVLMGGIYFISPYLTEFKEKKNYSFLKNFLNITYNLLIFSIIPFSLVLYLYPELILTLLFGQKFAIASEILKLLSLFLVFNLFLNYNLYIINAFGLASKLVKIIYPIVIMNLILNIFLVNLFGIVGVVWATVLSWVLITVFTIKIILLEVESFKLNYNNYFKIFVLSLFFLLLINFLKSIFFIYNFYLTAFLILFVSFVIYFLLGNLIKIYSLDEIYLFIPDGKFKNKIKYYHNNYFKFLK